MSRSMFERAVAFAARRWDCSGPDPWRSAERELLGHAEFGPWLDEVEDFDERLDFAGYIVRRAADAQAALDG